MAIDLIEALFVGREEPNFWRSANRTDQSSKLAEPISVKDHERERGRIRMDQSRADGGNGKSARYFHVGKQLCKWSCYGKRFSRE